MNDANLNKIVLIQIKAIRVMLKLNEEESVESLFGSLKILTVFWQHILYETINSVKNNPQKMYYNHHYNNRNKN